VENTADTHFFSRTTPFSGTSETAAVVRVSSDPSSIGVITHCNPVALRLFGYTKREMMGRDMSALLPEPIASVHALFLKSFLRDGKIKVINTTRVMFGVRRAGHIFPMRGNVRPLEDGFVGVFESIPTSQCFLVFTGAASGWRLHAACAASMSALGLEPADLRSDSHSLRALVPGIDAPGAFAAMKGDGVTAPVAMAVGVRPKEGAAGSDARRRPRATTAPSMPPHTCKTLCCQRWRTAPCTRCAGPRASGTRAAPFPSAAAPAAAVTTAADPAAAAAATVAPPPSPAAAAAAARVLPWTVARARRARLAAAACRGPPPR
jgi:PAS domain S-box-containing protein